MYDYSWSDLREEYELSLLEFDMVKLLNPMEKISLDIVKSTRMPCFKNCFWYRNDGSSCDECQTEEILLSRKEAVKLRFFEQRLYLVVTNYVIFSNYEFVMEKILEIKSVNRIISNNQNVKDMVLSHVEDISKSFMRDELTGAKNRRFLYHNLPILLKKAEYNKKDVGLAIFDIDKFKHINDSLGHNIGDEVLKKVTQILKSSIRESESDSVIRLGGDEFLLVVYEITKEKFEKKICEMLNLISEIDLNGIIESTITISVGVVMYSELSKIDIDELMIIADKRLYDSKREKYRIR